MHVGHARVKPKVTCRHFLSEVLARTLSRRARVKSPRAGVRIAEYTYQLARISECANTGHVFITLNRRVEGCEYRRAALDVVNVVRFCVGDLFQRSRDNRIGQARELDNGGFNVHASRVQ